MAHAKECPDCHGLKKQAPYMPITRPSNEMEYLAVVQKWPICEGCNGCGYVLVEPDGSYFRPCPCNSGKREGFCTCDALRNSCNVDEIDAIAWRLYPALAHGYETVTFTIDQLMEIKRSVVRTVLTSMNERKK